MTEPRFAEGTESPIFLRNQYGGVIRGSSTAGWTWAFSGSSLYRQDDAEQRLPRNSRSLLTTGRELGLDLRSGKRQSGCKSVNLV
jgi:hypothetical protein